MHYFEIIFKLNKFVWLLIFRAFKFLKQIENMQDNGKNDCITHNIDDFGNQGIFGAQEKIGKKELKNLCKPVIKSKHNCNIATQEIKVIVDGLNRPPFMWNLSLVDFDDKTPYGHISITNIVWNCLNCLIKLWVN